MSTFTETYGDLTQEQVENLRTVAQVYRSPMEAVPLLIEKMAGLQPTYGNVQFVLDVLAGDVKGEA